MSLAVCARPPRSVTPAPQCVCFSLAPPVPASPASVLPAAAAHAASHLHPSRPVHGRTPRAAHSAPAASLRAPCHPAPRAVSRPPPFPVCRADPASPILLRASATAPRGPRRTVAAPAPPAPRARPTSHSVAARTSRHASAVDVSSSSSRPGLFAAAGGGGGAVEIERPAPNRRVVRHSVRINAPLDVVWSVLSDYERLAEYIPNLALSRRRTHPSTDGIRLEQCGVQSILGFEFRASVVMDMTEVNAASEACRAIDFVMVESRDFREFAGTWRMVVAEDGMTELFYHVEIVPKGLVPVKAIEWRIAEDVPQNMDAVRRQCEIRRRAATVAAKRAQNGTAPPS